jgi:hypothetical protein
MPGSLNEQLELWARWVVGGEQLQATSIMQKIMDGKAFEGTGGAAQPLIQCCESEIEAFLLSKVDKEQQAVEILRVEYGVKRLGALPLDASQSTRALRMGISLRTYERKLSGLKGQLKQHLQGRGFL